MIQTKYLIYALQDPITYEIRYIGLSTIGLKRISQHTQPSFLSKDKSHKGNWLRQLINNGFKPIYKILHSFNNISRKELQELEVYWIAYFKKLECPLTNLTIGGDGANGYKWSENDIRRFRPHPMQGKKLTDEQKAEVSRLTKLAMKNPEVKAKISNAKKGKTPWNKGKTCKN